MHYTACMAICMFGFFAPLHGHLHVHSFTLRDHPFNLKEGGGLWFFGEKLFPSIFFYVFLCRGQKNYSENTLCFKMYC